MQCGGPKAHEVNERLVDGHTVTLRFDAERRDVYGRLLAYVYLPRARPGGRPLFVNAELARRGLARTLTIPPNDCFAPPLRPPGGPSGRARVGPVGKLPSIVKRDPRGAWTKLLRLGSCKALLACTAARGAIAMAQMRMRQSMSQIELAFEQEMALERRRREQLRKRAVNRSRARRITRNESRGKVRFSVLLVCLTITVVTVVVSMFETLAWLMG